MSYSHTKRRKKIAHLKRRYPNNWHSRLLVIAGDIATKQKGPCTGTLADLIPAGPYSDQALRRDIEQAERAVTEEMNYD